MKGLLGGWRNFVQDVEDNMSTYTARGELTLQGLKLIRKEVKKRKKRMNHSDVAKGADEILKLAGKVKKIIFVSWSPETGERQSSSQTGCAQGR